MGHRKLLALVLAVLFGLLACLATAQGQDVPLSVTGGTPQTVLTTLPFTVQAPAGGIFYQFAAPPGLTGSAKANRYVVTAAAKGTYTVSVTYAVIDFAAQTVTTCYGETTFSVGDVGPGPAPPPGPPGPPADLLAALQPGWQKDGGGTAANLAKARQAAVVLRAVATADLSKLKTVGDVYQLHVSLAKAHGLAESDLTQTKIAWAGYLGARLPKTSQTPLTDVLRAAVVAEYSNFALTLEALK